MSNVKIKYVCPECGSDEVSRDACVRWNVDSQAWEPTGIYDDAHCDACDSDLKYLDDIKVGE
jgi:hypothetical protein